MRLRRRSIGTVAISFAGRGRRYFGGWRWSGADERSIEPHTCKRETWRAICVKDRPLNSEGGDQSVKSWCCNARAVMMSKDFARGLELPYLGQQVGPALEWTASLQG